MLDTVTYICVTPFEIGITFTKDTIPLFWVCYSIDHRTPDVLRQKMKWKTLNVNTTMKVLWRQPDVLAWSPIVTGHDMPSVRRTQRYKQYNLDMPLLHPPLMYHDTDVIITQWINVIVHISITLTCHKRRLERVVSVHTGGSCRSLSISLSLLV